MAFVDYVAVDLGLVYCLVRHWPKFLRVLDGCDALEEVLAVELTQRRLDFERQVVLKCLHVVRMRKARFLAYGNIALSTLASVQRAL